jgi:lipopolysaccharide biosynthesis protein
MNLFPAVFPWFRKKNDPNYIPELDIGIGVRPKIKQDYALAIPFSAPLSTHGIARVAVIAHIFYPDLCEELMRPVNNIPAQADLFISTDTEEKRDRIQKSLKTYTHGTVEIRVFPNRGRDIAPTIVGYADVFDRYDYFLHLHTKKTLFDSNLSEWRSYLYHNLAGSREIAATNLTLLERADMGVVFPHHYDLVRPAVNWGHCFRRSRDLLGRAGMTITQKTPLEFPSGSMFWGKSKALRPLLDLKLEFSDFDEEAGQVDGTLAHVLEHSLLYFVEEAGYTWTPVASEAYPHRAPLLAVKKESDISVHLKKIYRPLLIQSTDLQDAKASHAVS